MRLQLDHFGQLKSYIHMGQGAVLFIAWVLTIALFTRAGTTDGRVGWYFGLCFLTIPILIYLVMVPMWSRARKFANVYAFASLDALSVLLWLSAWAAVASYLSSGKGKGDNKDAEGCDNFKYGSPGRCKLSGALVAFGVIQMLLFGATAFFSFRTVMTFKQTGMMPATQMGGQNTDLSAQNQDAFSSNMRTDEEFDDDREASGRQEYNYQKPSFEDEYAPIHQSDHDEMAHLPPAQEQSPLNQSGLGIQSYDTSYNNRFESEQKSGR